jgi:hypothetical protein
MLTVNFTYSGMASGVTGAHIHCCVAAGLTVGVATTLPWFDGFVDGATSGTFNATFDMSQGTNYNPAFITMNGGMVATAEAAFANGFVNEQTYLNLHDSVYPGGEIRLLLTPEPGTLYFVPLAMLALCFLRKRSA